MSKLTDFAKGIIAGVLASLVLFSVFFSIWFFHRRDKELIEYVEKQQVIETLREDYSNRDPVEFLDDIPGVRESVDGASSEFLRKRDEALQRLRDRLSSRAGLTD